MRWVACSKAQEDSVIPGQEGERAHVWTWTPGDGDFQGTAGPRDADILSLPAAHP